MRTLSSPFARRLVVSGLLAGSVLLTACGGGDDSSSLVTASPDTTAQTQSTEQTESTEQGGGDSGGVDIPDVAGLPEGCRELAEALAGAFAGLDDASSMEEAGQMFGPLAEAMEALKGDIPSELDADLDVMAAAYRTIDEVMAEYDYDMMQAFTDPAAMETLQALDSPEFTASNERLTAYFDEQCPSS
jgi:hypothetical protein